MQWLARCAEVKESLTMTVNASQERVVSYCPYISTNIVSCPLHGGVCPSVCHPVWLFWTVKHFCLPPSWRASFFTSTFKLLWTWWLSWRGCNREVTFFTNYTLLLSVLSSSVVIINLLLKDSWVFLLTVKDRKGLSSIVKIYPKISGVKQRNLNSQPTNLTTQYFGFYSSPF